MEQINLASMSPVDSLPHYTTCPPPCYSSRVSEGEEVLAATRVYQTPTGSFTTQCHCGNLTVTLKEQNEDIETPIYHQQGVISGTVHHSNPEHFLQVFLKIEGKLKLNVIGQTSNSSTTKIIDESYELWSRKPEVTPLLVDFAIVLPSTFRAKDKEFPLPPSHKISLTGIPGLHTQCTYTLKVVEVVRGPLWNKTKSFPINFKYLPRSRPSAPSIFHTGISATERPLFVDTVKRSPGLWFETHSTLKGRPSFKLAPIEVQFFIPSQRTFGLADKIPFHIQLTGSVASLQLLYSHIRFKHSDDARTSKSSTPSSPTLTSLDDSHSQNFISLSVSLNRQVCVEAKETVVWKSFVIGEGRVHPPPPLFESVVKDEEPSCSSSDQSRIGFLESAGEIQCLKDAEFGTFDAGIVQVKDYLLLQIGPLKPSDHGRSPFIPFKVTAPVTIVSESWDDDIII